MKKFLSIVISILMISAMMSVVALADAATISLSPISGLVAGESVELDVAAADGTTYTVSVNSQVFELVGGTTSGSITSVDVTAPAKATLTVKSSVPSTFTSAIKLQEAGKDAVMVNVSVADRLIGDANGDGEVDALDVSQILRNKAGLSVVADFKAVAGNVNGDSDTDAIDASQILRKKAGLSVTNANIGVAYIGGNAAITIVDPFAGGGNETTPLAAPANPVAYYSNGKVYYEFDAVANASSYTITVGSDTFTGITATSGSVTLSGAWNGTDTFDVVAVGDGVSYSDSTTAATATITNAPVGAFSAWVTTNGGLDAVTVYELN